MRIVASLTTAAAALSGIAIGASSASAAATDLVDFGGQAGLKACVASVLNRPVSDEFTVADLASPTFTSLSCSNAVSDLHPLSLATNLVHLSLSGNSITDLSPLAGLAALTDLTVSLQDIPLPAALPNVPFALPVITDVAGNQITPVVNGSVLGSISGNEITWEGTGYATMTWGKQITYGTGFVATFNGSMHQEVKHQMMGLAPTISGDAVVGSTLTAITTTGGPYSTHDYRWMSDGIDIPGAMSETYIPTAADLDHVITVEVSIGQGGYFPLIKTSEPTAPVIAGAPIDDPIVSDPADGGVDGGADGGADGGVDVGVDSGVVINRIETAVAVDAALTRTPTPRIAGTAKVGKKLTAKAGTWNTGVALHYRWYANGKAVKGATRITWVVTKATKTKKITVRVTGSKAGFVSVTRVSKATSKVK